MEREKGYRKLKVWEKANELAIETYRITTSFPREEIYGLTSQLRRAVFSVPTNIVEGHSSKSRKEFLNFLNIANRSLTEVEYIFSFCKELKVLNDDSFDKLEGKRREVAAILNAFTKGVLGL